MRTWLILGASLLIWPATAAAQSALESGRALFDELEYEAAIPHFEQAMEDESAPAEDRALAALHLGIIHVAFGDQDKAMLRFGDALRLDPQVTLPAAMSPHVVELFESSRSESALAPAEEVEPEDDSILRHTPPPPSAGRARIEVSLSPAREVEIERMVVRHRRRGEGLWFETTAQRQSPSSFEAELPAPGSDGAPVEYYVEAFDRRGERVAQLASAAVPLIHGPASPTPGDAGPGLVTPRPFYTQWWFFAGTGAVVTGAIIGGLIAGQSSGGCDAPSGHGCIQVGFE